MTAKPQNPLDLLGTLKPRGKTPRSKNVLVGWINAAHTKVDLDPARLEWLIASTVVAAVLQRIIDSDGRHRFLLKGGTYLQHRLNWSGRPTKDLDGLVRGDIDYFIEELDKALREDWGPLQFERTEVQIINTPAKVVKPRAFDIQVKLAGDVWRKVKVEISPDEAGASTEHDVLRAPVLDHFGIPTPNQLVGIALRFQIAQKIHACTDPHNAPVHVNDRARDLVDLILLRTLSDSEGFPAPVDLREACLAVFDARAAESRELDRPVRTWPPTVVAYPHWGTDYERAASAGGIEHSLEDAVTEVSGWIAVIDAAGVSSRRGSS